MGRVDGRACARRAHGGAPGRLRGVVPVVARGCRRGRRTGPGLRRGDESCPEAMPFAGALDPGGVKDGGGGVDGRARPGGRTAGRRVACGAWCRWSRVVAGAGAGLDRLRRGDESCPEAMPFAGALDRGGVKDGGGACVDGRAVPAGARLGAPGRSRGVVPVVAWVPARARTGLAFAGATNRVLKPCPSPARARPGRGEGWRVSMGARVPAGARLGGALWGRLRGVVPVVAWLPARAPDWTGLRRGDESCPEAMPFAGALDPGRVKDGGGGCRWARGCPAGARQGRRVACGAWCRWSAWLPARAPDWTSLRRGDESCPEAMPFAGALDMGG